MDVDEIHEIHDEEAHLIHRLDCLVEKFMKQFHDLALPLRVFLQEHWKQRIQAEILEKDAMSEKEKERFEELGAIFLEDEKIDAEEKTADALENDGYDSYDEWIGGIASSIKWEPILVST